MFEFTLEELQGMTKGDIVGSIASQLGPMTKREIMEYLLGIDSYIDRPSITYAPDGQIASRVVITCNVLGERIRNDETIYSYYPTGEIDTITIIEHDAEDNEIDRRTIKHYLDGRQPTVE